MLWRVWYFNKTSSAVICSITTKLVLLRSFPDHTTVKDSVSHKEHLIWYFSCWLISIQRLKFFFLTKILKDCLIWNLIRKKTKKLRFQTIKFQAKFVSSALLTDEESALVTKWNCYKMETVSNKPIRTDIFRAFIEFLPADNCAAQHLLIIYTKFLKYQHCGCSAKAPRLPVACSSLNRHI